jgi:PadR family transcriptional regulator, regulatory protein PadR
MTKSRKGRGAHLGDLEELVLLTVLRLGREAHGSAIREELRAEAGRAVSISTVYVTLMRLEEKGYARSWKGEPSAKRGGKAKRHFEVRPAGLEVLEAVRAVRERMWQGVQEGEAHG